MEDFSMKEYFERDSAILMLRRKREGKKTEGILTIGFN
jgi:hypothetical protein